MKNFTITFFCTLFAFQLVSAQAPMIHKVEPPNWWAGMQYDTIQLMVYGENLKGVSATFNDKNLEVLKVNFTGNPTYAFVDVVVSKNAKPGNYELTLSKGKQKAVHQYGILKRENNPKAHQGFDKSDVIYLITLDRFADGDQNNNRVGDLDEYNPSKDGMRHGGDLQGLIDHLDYIQDLGITTIWLMPVLENRGKNSYHGYSATDHYKIDPRFGTNADYKRFVEEAHKRGLKVIFDHVNNHIGIEHPWIKNLPEDTWINGTVEDHMLGKHYKLALTDPYTDPKSKELLRDFWFVDEMPDLNQRNPYLAKYLIQNTLWWMEYAGLDGIREDTYPYPDQPFLADWAKAILDEYPASNIVGEIWALQSSYLAMFQTESKLPRDFETNLPSIMDFALCESLRNFLNGKGKLMQVYDVIAQDFLYSDVDNIMTFIDNHDMTRGIYEAQGNTERLKTALTILLTTRGIPQLLYGNEIDMVGGESHVRLRADFPGGFHWHNRSAFTAEGRTDRENDMFNYTQKLLQLRKKHPALTEGKLIHYPVHWKPDVYMYFRIHESETILVIANGEHENATVDLSDIAYRLQNVKSFKNLMTGELLLVDIEKGINMEGLSTLVLKLE